MKKIIALLLTIFLISPLNVNADAKPKVLTLEAEANNNVITYNGTTEANSHAVMCKLYDNNKEIDMLSVEVNNSAFEGTFNVPSSGDYKVACANYEGGEIKETTISATVVIPTYTVTFSTEGGSAIAPVTVEENKTVAEPAIPTKEGFEFGGWFEDQTLTTPFDFSTPITDNTTLYAKWTDEPVAVHTVFFGEGGTYIVDFETDDSENQGPLGAPITQSGVYFVPAGNQMSLTAIPADGFSFKGWYRGNVNAQTPEEWPTNELLSSATVYTFTPTGTPYIVPVFEDHRTYMVTFNTNGGSNIQGIEVSHNDLVELPEDPTKDGFIFDGWYEDATLKIEFNPNTEITDNLTLYAKWIDNSKTYTVKDENGNEISFKDEKGHEFNLIMIDITKLSDEELEELEVTREEYEEVEKQLKEALKKQGTLLSVYEILVINEDDNNKELGPFIIKIKMTDEMKKFNSFKLLYIDFDNNFKIEETKVLKVEDGYLVGQLDHLSNYVLVGDTVDTSSSNPKTLDNIYVWIITLLVSFIGLLSGTIYTKKFQKRTNKR